MKINRMYRSRLKNRISVQDQGGAKVQPAGILKYSEELKRGPNTEIGPIDFFEIASSDANHDHDDKHKDDAHSNEADNNHDNMTLRS